MEGIKNRPKELAETSIVAWIRHDSSTVWLDHDAGNSKERFKCFATERDGGMGLTYRISADGVHWSDPLAKSRIWGNRTTAFYNPFRKVWVLSQRIHGRKVGRCKSYLEDADPRRLVEKTRHNPMMHVEGESVFWARADKLDPRNPDPEFAGIESEIYSLDAAPYESLLLGLFSIYQGPDNDVAWQRGIKKRCDVLVGFSRDGFHWHRPSRERFITATWKEGTWNFSKHVEAGRRLLPGRRRKAVLLRRCPRHPQYRYRYKFSGPEFDPRAANHPILDTQQFFLFPATADVAERAAIPTADDKPNASACQVLAVRSDSFGKKGAFRIDVDREHASVFAHGRGMK